MDSARLTEIRARRERLLVDDPGVINEVYCDEELRLLVEDDVLYLLLRVAQLETAMRSALAVLEVYPRWGCTDQEVAAGDELRRAMAASRAPPGRGGGVITPVKAPLSAELAEGIWSLLVAEAGASEEQRVDFVRYVTSPSAGVEIGTREYRFQGLLGFGGKLYVTGWGYGVRISGYREDWTPERQRIISLVNRRLIYMLAVDS